MLPKRGSRGPFIEGDRVVAGGGEGGSMSIMDNLPAISETRFPEKRRRELKIDEERDIGGRADMGVNLGDAGADLIAGFGERSAIGELVKGSPGSVDVCERCARLEECSSSNKPFVFNARSFFLMCGGRPHSGSSFGS